MEAIFLFSFIQESFVSVELVILNLPESVAFSCGYSR